MVAILIILQLCQPHSKNKNCPTQLMLRGINATTRGYDLRISMSLIVKIFVFLLMIDRKGSPVTKVFHEGFYLPKLSLIFSSYPM